MFTSVAKAFPSMQTKRRHECLLHPVMGNNNSGIGSRFRRFGATAHGGATAE
jgi:hypothetical protein